MLYDDCFREPDYKPVRPHVLLEDDVLTVKLGEVSFGMERDREKIQNFIDAVEFVTLTRMSNIQKDEMVDDLARVLLGMEK